jgi:uncharacterized protein
MHFGIDFGAKLAGTTAICYDTSDALVILQSQKKQDADLFCSELIQHNSPEFIMIDAPLSLPKAFFGEGEDFFYRSCDRQMKAMSPMFLGGLTARAIRLANFWKSSGVVFFETYPRMVSLRFSENFSAQSDEHFCKNIVDLIRNETGLEIRFSKKSKHSYDALLAWYAGYHKNKGSAKKAGDQNEGIIWY